MAGRRKFPGPLVAQRNLIAQTHRMQGHYSFANCSVALRSSSGSVRCIKHNYPDHHDKSERQKRGQRHELLPVFELWTEPPILFVTAITSLSQDQCFAFVAASSSPTMQRHELRPLNGGPFFVSGSTFIRGSRGLSRTIGDSGQWANANLAHTC